MYEQVKQMSKTPHNSFYWTPQRTFDRLMIVEKKRQQELLHLSSIDCISKGLPCFPSSYCFAFIFHSPLIGVFLGS